MPKLSESTPCTRPWINYVEDLIVKIDKEKHVRNLPTLLDESKMALIRLLDTRTDPQLVAYQGNHVTTRIVNHPVFTTNDGNLNADAYLEDFISDGWELLQVEYADRIVDGLVVRTPVYVLGQTRDTVMSALRTNEEKLIKDLLHARAKLVQVKEAFREANPESVKLIKKIGSLENDKECLTDALHARCEQVTELLDALEEKEFLNSGTKKAKLTQTKEAFQETNPDLTNLLRTINTLKDDRKGLIRALHGRDKRIVELSDALAKLTNPGPEKARKPEPTTPPDEGAVDLVAEFLLNFMQTFNRHNGKQKS